LENSIALSIAILFPPNIAIAIAILFASIAGILQSLSNEQCGATGPQTFKSRVISVVNKIKV